MARRILVPIDGSSSSDHAFRYALRLAKARRASLEIWSVVDAIAILGHTTALRGERSRIETARAVAARVIGKALTRAARCGIPASGHVEIGRPAELIVARAARVHAESIVMGSHGESGFKRLFMGSVAETILRSSSCPVVIVRGKAVPEPAESVVQGIGETVPVFTLRVLEVAPRDFERLYNDLAEFWEGAGAEMEGFIDAELLASRDNRRIAVLAHFRSYHDWVRAQWNPRLGKLLEEIAENAQTIEFELYRGDHFTAKRLDRPREVVNS
ncbi:MAG TPA: universal stress protein [Candidatus Nitrosotalea sp.]|nr:universal stress protein [Candidatus Nitrosotalea sp.]